MKNYFRQIPDFDYVSRLPESKISDYIKVKNLFKKAKLRDDIFQDVTVFTKYQIQGDDRPDNVAYEVYNDANLDWVILLSNNIVNIQTEWPLPQNDFDKILLERYKTYENLYSGIHHHETTEITNSLLGIRNCAKELYRIVELRIFTGGKMMKIRRIFEI